MNQTNNITVEQIRKWTESERISFFENTLLSTQRQGMEPVVNFIKTNTDFYTAPASTIYHSNFKGGLLEHSLIVYALAMQMRDMMAAQNPELDSKLNPVSVAICSLLHDVCKICTYNTAVKHIKNENGMWEDKLGYGFNDVFPIGHGEKSVILLLYYGLQLNPDEMLSIRYHMGMWDAGQASAGKSAESASHMTPLVPLLQTADYLASLTMETTVKL